jgi:DNA polymerase III, gamma/tau subunits
MFRLVTQKALTKHLRDVSTKESIEITDDAVELVARRAAGGLRDALGLLDQASLLARPGEPVSQSDLLVLLGALDEDVLMSVSKAVLERDGKSVIDALNNLLSQGREPVLITVELAKHFLNLAKASYLNSSEGSKDASAGSYILGSPSYIAALTEQAKQFERAELSQIVTELEKLEQTLKKSTLSSLTLEMGLLSICHRHEIASVNSLSERLMKLEAQIASGEIGVRIDPRNVPDARAQAAAGAGSAGSPRPSGPPPRPQETPPHRPEPLPHRQESLPHRPEPLPHRQEAAPAAPPPERPQPAPSERPSAPSEPPRQEGGGEERVDIREDSYDDDVDEEGGYSSGSGGSSSAQAPDLRASIIETPVESEPLPHHSNNESQGSSEGGVENLDHIWSNVLDALHKRSIPAYSLVSTHAFPIRLEGSAFTLGVRKEFFQKSIEAKAKQLEQAFMDVTGEEVRVIVKVVADDEGSKTKGSGSSGGASNPSPVVGNHERSQNREPAQSIEPSQNREPLPHHKSYSEPTQRESQSQGSTQRNESSFREPTSREGGHGDDDDEGEQRGSTNNNAIRSASNPSSRASTAVAPARTQQAVQAPKSSPADDNVPESSIIKEAYKLFEGPGSRLIG